MGSWGTGTFDDDDASDWLYELEASNDLSTIQAALRAVKIFGWLYLEAPKCSEALAAAEIVAALNGKPMHDLPDTAAAWVGSHRHLNAAPLIPKAINAIKRVRTKSELKSLWDESDHASEWYAVLDDLTMRLTT